VTSSAQKATSGFIRLVEAWLVTLFLAGRSTSEIACHRSDLAAFRAAVEQLLGRAEVRDIKLVGQSQIDLMAAIWETEGVGKQTVARRFSAVRGFAGYLCLTPAVDVDCSRLLAAKFPTAKSGRVPPAEPDDVDALSWAGPDGGWIELRNSAAFLTMACGTTTGETTGLDRSDVDLDRAVAAVRRTWLRPRPVPLSDAAVRAIETYIDELPRTVAPEEPLFQTTRRTRLSARSLQTAFRTRRRILGMSDELVLSSLRHAG
jgi:integrase/recombinase XerC